MCSSDLTTRTRLAAFTLNAFFTTAGAKTECSTNNQGDPTVVYDSISGRWILANFAWSNLAGPYYECMAVSKTADPVTGGWWVYQFPVSATDMNDYPKMAVWGDGIYLTANMFKGGNTFTGAKVWAFNRDDLTTGAALRYVAFQLSSSYYSLLAANARASAVPAGTPEYLVSLAGSSLRVWRVNLNWTTPTSSTLTGPTTIPVASYTRPNSINQPTGDKLDALADRIMNRVQYRADGTPSLWVTHTVSSSSKAATRWYQLNVSGASPTVLQSGTYQPTTGVHRWMGSMAVDKAGDAAIAYSVSSSSTYPGIRFAGRTATAALGTFDQSEQTLVNGTGAQVNGYNRWGDYSDLALDPSDGCTFWFTGEYYSMTGNAWRTRIGSFKLPTCV